MKNKIFKADELPDNEEVYLRKDMFGWRVVNPIKVDGSFNWKNLILGNRKVIIFTIIWLLIMGFIFYGVNEMISSCKDMTKNPCNYFKTDCSNTNSNYDILTQGVDKDGS